MTKDEVLAMSVGQELNKAVAEKVMEHVVAEDEIFGYMERLIDESGDSVWSPLQPYSEELSFAELVVEKMIERGHDEAIYWADFGDGLYTEPEAICRSALLALFA